MGATVNDHQLGSIIVAHVSSTGIMRRLAIAPIIKFTGFYGFYLGGGVDNLFCKVYSVHDTLFIRPLM